MKKKAIFKTIDGLKVKVQNFAAPIEFKAVDGEEGVIEAYVSIFGNVDSYGEIVDKGAFAEAIKNNFPRYPKGVANHDWTQPIAKTLEIREDERGLYVKAKLLLEIPKAKEVYICMKEGVITDFSFGYRVDEDAIDPETGFRHLKKLTPYEWSPVLVGANPKTTLVSVKADGKKDGEEEEEQEETEEAGDEGTEDPVDPPKPADPAPAPVADDPEKGLKAGRTISKANRAKIEAARDTIKGVHKALKDAHSALEDILSLADGDDEPDKGTQPAEVKSDDAESSTIRLVLKQAKKADNALNNILFTLKAKRK